MTQCKNCGRPYNDCNGRCLSPVPPNPPTEFYSISMSRLDWEALQYALNNGRAYIAMTLDTQIGGEIAARLGGFHQTVTSMLALARSGGL